MVDTGFIEATDKIVLAGTPFVVEKEVETVANMYPGRLVKRDTGDNQVEVNTAKNVAPYGWLGYEHTPIEYRPANKDTIYKVNDRAAVVFGSIVIRAKLATNQTIIMGDKLIGAAGGMLSKATQINIESDSTAVLSTAANGNIIDGSMGEEGPIVAEALESVTSTGTMRNIIVRSLI